MHYFYVDDSDDNLVDVVPFCSDSCHRQWCEATGEDYKGWNGCQEGGDYSAWCAHCGVWAGGTPECGHQSDNVVVNRFRCDSGEKCDCGHWIQLPSDRLESV
jgi:hypothetical protein